MATGDIQGNLDRLLVELRNIRYPHQADMIGAREGAPPALLPILHYVLLGFSKHVAKFIASKGYELLAKADLRFVEGVTKLLRVEFNYRTTLSPQQFLSQGYAERKLLFMYDVIKMCKKLHNDILREKKSSSAFSKRALYERLAHVAPGPPASVAPAQSSHPAAGGRTQVTAVQVKVLTGDDISTHVQRMHLADNHPVHQPPAIQHVQQQQPPQPPLASHVPLSSPLTAPLTSSLFLTHTQSSQEEEESQHSRRSHGEMAGWTAEKKEEEEEEDLCGVSGNTPPESTITSPRENHEVFDPREYETQIYISPTKDLSPVTSLEEWNSSNAPYSSSQLEAAAAPAAGRDEESEGAQGNDRGDIGTCEDGGLGYSGAGSGEGRSGEAQSASPMSESITMASLVDLVGALQQSMREGERRTANLEKVVQEQAAKIVILETQLRFLTSSSTKSSTLPPPLLTSSSSETSSGAAQTLQPGTHTQQINQQHSIIQHTTHSMRHRPTTSPAATHHANNHPTASSASSSSCHSAPPLATAHSHCLPLAISGPNSHLTPPKTSGLFPNSGFVTSGFQPDLPSWIYNNRKLGGVDYGESAPVVQTSEENAIVDSEDGINMEEVPRMAWSGLAARDLPVYSVPAALRSAWGCEAPEAVKALPEQHTDETPDTASIDLPPSGHSNLHHTQEATASQHQVKLVSSTRAFQYQIDLPDKDHKLESSQARERANRHNKESSSNEDLQSFIADVSGRFAETEAILGSFAV